MTVITEIKIFRSDQNLPTALAFGKPAVTSINGESRLYAGDANDSPALFAVSLNQTSGTEHQTAEIFAGKPVYQMLFDISSVTAAQVINSTITSSYVDALITMSFSARSTSAMTWAAAPVTIDEDGLISTNAVDRLVGTLKYTKA